MFLKGIKEDEVVIQPTSRLADRIRNGESLKMSGGADIMSGRPDGLIAAGVDMICSAVGDVFWSNYSDITRVLGPQKVADVQGNSRLFQENQGW